MRASSSSHEVKSGARPGLDAWSPARQTSDTAQPRHEIRQRNDFPPRPEAPSATAPTPGDTAPLAPHLSQARPAANHAQANGEDLRSPTEPIVASREEAVREIENADRALHRARAIWTQLRVVGAEAPHVGPLLHEAGHEYEQGISSLRHNSFVTAGEFAAAASELSLAAAILLQRAIRAVVTDESCVPPTGGSRSASTATPPSQEDFSEAGRRLARIYWLLENGTLPSEARDQARRIADWSERLFLDAQRSLRDGSWEDALELVQAAGAAVRSAEHVCRKCYLKEN